MFHDYRPQERRLGRIRRVPTDPQFAAARPDEASSRPRFEGPVCGLVANCRLNDKQAAWRLRGLRWSPAGWGSNVGGVHASDTEMCVRARESARTVAIRERRRITHGAAAADLSAARRAVGPARNTGRRRHPRLRDAKHRFGPHGIDSYDKLRPMAARVRER